MISPVLEFSPSIGPAAILSYSGKAFPEWKGNLMVGCMRGESILNVQFSKDAVSTYEFLLKKTFGRIRAMTQGPDGFLYFSTSQVDPPESRLTVGERGYDMILRARPAKRNERGIASEKVELQKAIVHATVNQSKGERTASSIYVQLCASCHGANLKVPGRFRA